jgi:hypothetical protein
MECDVHYDEQKMIIDLTKADRFKTFLYPEEILAAEPAAAS